MCRAGASVARCAFDPDSLAKDASSGSGCASSSGSKQQPRRHARTGLRHGWSWNCGSSEVCAEIPEWSSAARKTHTADRCSGRNGDCRAFVWFAARDRGSEVSTSSFEHAGNSSRKTACSNHHPKHFLCAPEHPRHWPEWNGYQVGYIKHRSNYCHRATSARYRAAESDT